MLEYRKLGIKEKKRFCSATKISHGNVDNFSEDTFLANIQILRIHFSTQSPQSFPADVPASVRAWERPQESSNYTQFSGRYCLCELSVLGRTMTQWKWTG